MRLVLVWDGRSHLVHRRGLLSGPVGLAAGCIAVRVIRQLRRYRML